MKRKMLIIIILMMVSIGLFSGCASLFGATYEEARYTGVLFDVQITSEKLIVVFNDGFYFTFHNPTPNLIDKYPYLDSIESNYAHLVIHRGESVALEYVRSSGGDNYL